RAFLRERALPFLTAAAEFYEDFLTEEGFNPSYSPENTPADTDGQACVNATMDVAAVRDLVRNLVRAHRILGLPGARRWVALVCRLPGYRIGEGGVLAEWPPPLGRGEPNSATSTHTGTPLICSRSGTSRILRWPVRLCMKRQCVRCVPACPGGRARRRTRWRSGCRNWVWPPLAWVWPRRPTRRSPSWPPGTGAPARSPHT